jgi:hypothetical protein
MKTLLIAILLGGFVCCGFGQPTPMPASVTNKLSVRLLVPGSSASLHAPANLNLLAAVKLAPMGFRPSGTARVDFFEHSKYLGTSQAVWHPMIKPATPPGSSHPLWIDPPGFHPAVFAWKAVPAGSYIFTARATWTNGLTAVSAPVQLTVAGQ